MTDKELIKANELKREITELELFILSAESTWTGKLIKTDTKYIFKSNGYGAISAKEFNMNTKIKNRVLGVLKEYLKELKNELENI